MSKVSRDKDHLWIKSLILSHVHISTNDSKYNNRFIKTVEQTYCLVKKQAATRQKLKPLKKFGTNLGYLVGDWLKSDEINTKCECSSVGRIPAHLAWVP